MINKALKKGQIWENFGQKELRKLRDKHPNNNEINKLDQWASHFDLSQLK